MMSLRFILRCLFLSCIGLTLSTSVFASNISLEVFSSGLKTATYPKNGLAKISLNGVDYSKNKTGINLVVLDQYTGELIKSTHFNTSSSKKAAEKLAEFINRLDEGNIVLAAVKKDASHRINNNAIEALYSLGASSFEQGKNGSWVLIGAVGLGKGNGQQIWHQAKQSPSMLNSTITITSTIPTPSTALLFLLLVVMLPKRSTS